MMFDAIDLMTKEQLASEIIGRTKRPAIVIFQEDDSEHCVCFQSFFAESDPRSKDSAAISSLLHQLADMFEGAEYHPEERREEGE